MTAHLRAVIKNHRTCIAWPACALSGQHVRLSDDELAELRALSAGSEPRTRSAPSRQPSVQPRRQPTAQPRRPSEAQWKAVRLALEKFTARGRYVHLAPRLLPADIRITWTGDQELDADTRATMRDCGSHCEIVLRLSEPPERLHRSVIHELCHVHDLALIRAGRPAWPREAIERRAEEVTAMLGGEW